MKVRSRVDLVFVAIYCVSGIAAQTAWSTVGPAPTGLIAGTYDSVRGRIIGFCLENATTGAAGTWELDGATWSRNPAATPPGVPRAMCFDTTRNVIVLVGGYPVSTYEFNGQSWTLRSSSGPLVDPAGLAYNRARQTTMMFSDLSGVGPTNLLWEWDGSTWRQISNSNPPPDGPYYQAMVYDIERDRFVVYGGDATAYAIFEWDPVVGWQGPTNGPMPGFCQLAYDEARRCLVMGGRSSSGVHQIWEKTSLGPWILRATGIQAGPMTFDSGRNRIIRLGTTVYSYAPIFPAEYTLLAPGCPGALGVPTISLAASWSRAWLGDSLSVVVRNLPMASAVLVLGFSSTNHGGLSLPADLAPFGAPGCALRVSVDSYSVILGSSGEATWSAPVPNTTALRGIAYYQQAIAPDPGRNAAGLVVSDAMAGTIGSR